VSSQGLVRKCGYCEGMGVIRMEKCWFVGVLIVLSFLGTKIWVEGYPIEDLVVRLPGQPKVEFKQYLVELYNRYIHFYRFNFLLSIWFGGSILYQTQN
jgi:hypothetical protein